MEELWIPALHPPEDRAPARRHVLLVEDDEDCALSLSIILSRYFDVSIRECAREGIDCYSVSPPDVLVVDYELPDMNGIRMVESLRRNLESHVPAVLISAYSDRGPSCQRAGIEAFLAKPLDLPRFVQVLEVLTAR